MNDLYLLIMAILVAVVVLTVVLLIKINHRPHHDEAVEENEGDNEYVDEDLTVTLINQPSLIKPGLVKPLKHRSRPTPKSGLTNTAMLQSNLVQESDFK